MVTVVITKRHSGNPGTAGFLGATNDIDVEHINGRSVDIGNLAFWWKCTALVRGRELLQGISKARFSLKT